MVPTALPSWTLTPPLQSIRGAHSTLAARVRNPGMQLGSTHLIGVEMAKGTCLMQNLLPECAKLPIPPPAPSPGAGGEGTPAAFSPPEQLLGWALPGERAGTAFLLRK